jgi:hypothetical protein
MDFSTASVVLALPAITIAAAFFRETTFIVTLYGCESVERNNFHFLGSD